MTEQTVTAPTEEDVAKTIAEYERAAIATGARCDFEAPVFSADGVTWSKVWLEAEPPVAVMARCRRDGAESEVVILWRDVVPADEAWRALWGARPMPLFGAYARRAAILHAFRDVFGERREPGDNPLTIPEPAERDWDSEIAAAPTADRLTEIWAEARAARARTGAREVAYEARLAQLKATEPDVWGPPANARVPRDFQRPARPSATKRKKGRRR